jgi:hypothetical protein
MRAQAGCRAALWRAKADNIDGVILHVASGADEANTAAVIQ